MAKAIVYLKAPLYDGINYREAVAGDFNGDEVNLFTNIDFGGLIIPLSNVAAVLGLPEDFDFSSLDGRQEILVGA
jgi:hypothetical protein